MTQLLLLPDPRPLVERLGAEFFREAPEGPGVYLMRDAAGTVLYVGKAKNLRKRLASYRVANPDCVPRRRLRLLYATARIEVQLCAHEAAALNKESALLRSLRPRYNRAGTWPGPARFLTWRFTLEGLELAIADHVKPGWNSQSGLGAWAPRLRAALARLLWCALCPQLSIAHMPEGWFRCRFTEAAVLPRSLALPADFAAMENALRGLFSGRAEAFLEWIQERSKVRTLPFETAAREADLEVVAKSQRLPWPHLTDSPERHSRP